jgi:hypothetical protein
MNLTLKPEGRLIRTQWVYDEEAEAGSYVDSDVSDQLMSYLMEAVKLDPELRLRDLFMLLERNPAVLDVFRRDWGAQFVAEYQRVRNTATPYTGEYDADGIEYLELYSIWEIEDGVLCGTDHLDFHGVGYELQDNVMQGEYVMHSKGTRINWAIDFSPLSELLNLPLRLNPEIVVCQGVKDVAAKYTVNRVLLAQVIRGVLWELSFHGGPKDAAEAAAEMQNRVQDVEEAVKTGDMSKFVPLEDVLKDLLIPDSEGGEHAV